MKKISTLTALLASALIGIAGSALAQKAEAPKEGEKKPDESAAKKSKVKKYDEVVTTNAVSKIGVFRVHRLDETLYYEIPEDALGVDMLWVVQISETTAGSSYAGMPVVDRVVRWEKREDTILLRDVRYSIRADTTDPIARAVKASNLAPIIRTFEVKAYGKDKAPVIDVTDLFKKDVPEFSAGRALGAGGMDSGRSFIEEFKAFPQNVNVRVLCEITALTPLELASSPPDRLAPGGFPGA